MRRYLPPEPTARKAPCSDAADLLRSAGRFVQPARSDPIRTALLVAATLASLLVAGVAVKALFSNHLQDVTSTQAPR